MKRFLLLAVLLQATLLSASAFCVQRLEVTAALREWRAAHGDSWRVEREATTGLAELLWGGSAAPVFSPRSEADWFAVARAFVDETAELHGIETSTLVDEAVTFLPLGLANGGTDKLTVRFEQRVNGVPVSGARLNVLMALDGSLLSLHSTASPDAQAVDTSAAWSAERASRRAAQLFLAETGLPADAAGQADGSQPEQDGPSGEEPSRAEQLAAPQLVIRSVEGFEARVPRLAWQVELRWSAPGVLPEGRRYWIDASTGARLDSERTVHQFDVGGTVSTLATPGSQPDGAGNPAATFPLADVRVTSSQGNAVTDANGSFNIPGASGPLSLTLEYVGPWNDVRHDSGTDYSLNVQAQTGQGNAILMNPAAQALVTAQANAFRHVSSVRDYIKSYFPADAEPDFTAISNANIASNCSAFFDGSSINFFVAGSGCPNTAYSSVVAHEYGHWLNVRYGTGNGSDGMGEGNADVWSMYTFDDPIIGEDLFGPGLDRRTGWNLRQFCGDCCSACYGETHDDGEVWMGTAWKIRNNLNTSLGNGAGDLSADVLYLSWLNSYNQSQIKSLIESQWLALDDNDGNIANGTPNYADIDGGFLLHGFPGVDLNLIEFQNVSALGDTQDQLGPYVVDATIQALVAPPLVNPSVHYRVDGGAFQSVPMASLGGDDYRGLIPGQTAPAIVEYYLSAEDSLSNGARFPEVAPAQTLGFRVGVLTVFLESAFEGPGNEGWTSGQAGDDATTGIWTRGDPIGTVAQPEDDHSLAGSLCWFTGQGSPGGSSGENDVDGGRTTLLSPVFDASGLTDPRVSYWRWYSNGTGSAPDEDIFEVDLSNDGGSSWSSVEVVGPEDSGSNGGWLQHEFALASVLPLSASMRLRFVASDEGSGSIVEAALDDIEGSDLSGGCAAPHNYGSAKLNSQLVAPALASTGQNSLTSNDLAIEITTQIPNQFSVLFWGPQSANIPFFGGSLLVGGGLVRLPLVQLDGAGHASIAIPISASMVDQTRFYQWWYRDPLHPDGTGIGLSDGLQVLFCN